MAKVSLRIYNRDIESLIDQGRLDEAIAHCRHILQTFPKHLETYRLLGKAYLEAKRYAEAVDIFNRVLTAVPDDFVSNVGMSIIRDEENRLDEAIWHMERAFESQPSNAAIQAELQRLYGRRDGVEPPKIRMTRGALAHMYVQGELYPQAISEIRAVLSEDPQRSDMQVLLARAFFKGGQKADASDMCNQLLKRYPYCFDANRIMVELLPASERAESTQVYRHRINELDPYSLFAKESTFRSSEVPDASVNLERLEYSGEDVEMTGEWGAQFGIGLGAAAVSSEQPEWLRAGLSESGTGKAPEPAEDESTGSIFGDFAAQRQGPLDQTPPTTAAPVSKSDSDIPDFLREAGWTESSGAGEEAAPMTPSEEEGLTPASIPDWLKDQMPSEAKSEARTEPAPASADSPDWLSGLGGASASQPEASSEEIPDWLRNLGGTEPAPAEKEASLPDWLSTPSPEDKNEAEPEQPAAPAASVESLGASAKEQDDAIAWLESLAAKHGAKPEELVSDPAARSDKPPEWVEQARALAESESQPQAGMDETGIWLRDLEEKEAAEPASTEEEQPSVSAGETPGWLGGIESAQAEEEKPLAEPGLPDWLSGLDQKPAEEAVEDELGAQAAPVPDWLSGLQEEPSASEPQRTNVADWLRELDRESKEEEPAAPQRSDVPDWLSGLESPSVAGVEEEAEDLQLPKFTEAEEEPSAQLPSEPAPAQAAPGDLPEWLRGLEQPEAEKEAAGAEEIPSWLKGDREEEESLGETKEGPRPERVTPADWHPAEAGREPSAPEPEYEAPRPASKAIPPLGAPQIVPPAPDVHKPAPAPAAPAGKPVKPGRAKQAESPQVSAASLNEAQGELNRGDIPAALDHYHKLIKKGKFLEETIRNLRDSLYRYPVEVGIWQALGDAYMRANRLQEALDAYNKAEELLR